MAMGDSELMYRFDGTTWTQHGTLYARAFCMQGRNLWRSPGTNTLAKVDTDAEPWTAGNWTSANQFNIGEKGSNITRIILNAAGVLLALKSDGIYTLDELGEDHQLYPGMRFSTLNTENGKYPYLAENWVYVTYGGTHYRIDPNMSLEPIGPEQSADNDSPIRGYVTAGIGTQFCNYAAVYSPDTADSYLMKFGAWVNDEQGSMKRIDAWHGSLSSVAEGDLPNTGSWTALPGTADFDADKITAMWRSTVGAAAGHERLYIGTLSGKIYWFTLPCTANPLACTSYNYPAGVFSGGFFFPFWHAGFPNEEKNIKAATATGTRLSNNSYVNNLQIRTAGDAGNPGNYPTDASGLAIAVPGKRSTVNRVVTLAEISVSLTNGSGAVATDTPALNGLGLSYLVRPPISLVYKTFHVLAENGLRNHEGTRLTIGADRIKSLMKTACNTTAGVTVITPDETSQTLVLKNYQEHLMWEEDIKQFRAVVSFIGISLDKTAGQVTAAMT